MFICLVISVTSLYGALQWNCSAECYLDSCTLECSARAGNPSCEYGCEWTPDGYKGYVKCEGDGQTEEYEDYYYDSCTGSVFYE